MDEVVKTLNPLEVIGVRDDLVSIEQVMLDTVHQLPPCYSMVADEVTRLMEAWSGSKRKAATPAGNTSKKSRQQPPNEGPGGSKGGRRFITYQKGSLRYRSINKFSNYLHFLFQKNNKYGTN